MVLYRCAGVEVHGLESAFRSVAFGSAFLLSFGRFWAGLLALVPFYLYIVITIVVVVVVGFYITHPLAC